MAWGMVLIGEKQNGGGGVTISAWETGESYSADEFVKYNGSLYLCKENHTAGTDFDVDAEAGKWLLCSDLQGNSKAWAQSINSPDGKIDTDSPTGYTQSAKTWSNAAKLSAESSESFAEQTANLVETQIADSTTTYNFPDVIVWTDGYNYRCVGTNVNVNDDIPGISQKWVCLSRITDPVWEIDTDGGLMPVINPIGDSNWELDLEGALMPTTASA